MNAKILFSAVAAALLPYAASAAIVTSATAPTMDSYDVGKTSFTTARNNEDDDQAHDGKRPGAYFTTPSSLTAYLMPSFSLQTRTGQADLLNLTVQLGTWDGSQTASMRFTQFASQTFSVPTAHNVGDWITFDFDGLTYSNTAFQGSGGLPQLAANSTYAVRIASSSTQGSVENWRFRWQNSNENTLAGAGWLNAGGYTESTDRLFVAHLTAVPEPAALSLLGLAGVGLGRRRR